MMHTHGEGDIESVADLFPGVGWGGDTDSFLCMGRGLHIYLSKLF